MTTTIALIAITTAISLTALYLHRNLLEKGMLRPYRTVRNRTWYEVITSGFLHGGMAHLLVNMFVLFFFGTVMEQVLGTIHFLALYFSGLVVSALPSLIQHKNNPGYATIGASGAVESVLFSYIYAFPTEKIILVLLPIPIPAWVFGILFLVYSIYEGRRGVGNVNHAAHIAGALWGMLYMVFFIPNSVSYILALFGWI